MGAIEDVRKVIQDLVAPDLKAIRVQLEELEKRIDQRFDAAENLAAERHNQVLVEIRRTQDVNALWEAVRQIQDRLPKQ